MKENNNNSIVWWHQNNEGILLMKAYIIANDKYHWMVLNVRYGLQSQTL